tara:strand:+ start:355 stop:1398 length:1044 start_codon:yes stop_codon:yes gene_type:complete
VYKNNKIKIAIIGSGWFGCHIGLKLKEKNFNIKIFEKGNDIFFNSSGNNTNRLHLGFHYPRSIKTRDMSYKGYKRFVKEYPKLSTKIKENIYAIADDNLNKISPKSFTRSMIKSKLKLNEYSVSQTDLKNVLKTFNTSERQIDHIKAKKFFLNNLKKNLYLNCEIKKITKINKKFKLNNELFDYVVNCTSQQSFKLNKLKLTYEHCVISLYKSKKRNHKSYTIMDGPYYTLLKWNKDIFGLYSVKFSRLMSSKNFQKVKKSYLNFKHKNQKTIQNNLVKDFLKFYPNFKNNFKFIKNLHSIRTINTNKNDARLSLVKNKNNFINVMSGKIDHIFYASDQVLKCIKIY